MERSRLPQNTNGQKIHKKQSLWNNGEGIHLPTEYFLCAMGMMFCCCLNSTTKIALLLFGWGGTNSLYLFHSTPDFDNMESAVKELEVGDEAGSQKLS